MIRILHNSDIIISEKVWQHVAETVQVQVPYPLSSEHEENRYHFHVVPPKLEIDIFLVSLCDEFVEHRFHSW